MINITFTHPDTSLDVIWAVSVKEHSLPLEKINSATAEAGDYIDPDYIYKGSYETAKIQTNPLKATGYIMFALFKRATMKGEPFIVEGSAVPLFGYDYSAHRTGDLKPKSLHGGRFFSFDMTVRILGAAD